MDGRKEHGASAIHDRKRGVHRQAGATGSCSIEPSSDGPTTNGAA
jgi:hypothetical protein